MQDRGEVTDFDRQHPTASVLSLLGGRREVLGAYPQLRLFVSALAQSRPAIKITIIWA